MIFYDVCDVFCVVCDRQLQLTDNSYMAGTAVSTVQLVSVVLISSRRNKLSK